MKTVPINTSINSDSGHNVTNDAHMNTASPLQTLPGKRSVSELSVDYGPALVKKSRQPRIPIQPEKSFLEELTDTSQLNSSYSDENNTTLVPGMKDQQSAFNDMSSAANTAISTADDTAGYSDRTDPSLLNDSTFTSVLPPNTDGSSLRPALTPAVSPRMVNSPPQSEDVDIMNNTTVEPARVDSIMNNTTVRPEYAGGIMNDTTARVEYPSIMDNTTRPLSDADVTNSGVSIYSRDYKDDSDDAAAGTVPLQRSSKWLDVSNFVAPHNRADISQRLPSSKSLFAPASYSTPRSTGRKRSSQFHDADGMDKSGKMSRRDKLSYDIDADMGFWTTKY